MDNIYNDCVAVSERNGPAWHEKGTVMTDSPMPVEALKRIHGDIEFEKAPMVVQLSNGQEIVGTDQFVVVRKPTFHDNDYAVLGTCGADYVTLDNIELAEMLEPLAKFWPVETVGVLGEGERFFMTLEATPIDIKGEEIKRFFLVADSKVPSQGGLSILDTRVRVVCWNTFQAALDGKSAVRVDLQHVGDIKMRLASIMEIYERLVDQQSAVDEALMLMADAKLPKGGVERIAKAAIPDRKVHAAVALAERAGGIENLSTMTEDRLAWVEKSIHVHAREMQRIERAREGIGQLYARICDESPAIAGTPWAAYNACTEFIDWGPMRGADADRSGRAMFGWGAQAKRRAFAEAYATAKRAR